MKTIHHMSNTYILNRINNIYYNDKFEYRLLFQSLPIKKMFGSYKKLLSNPLLSLKSICDLQDILYRHQVVLNILRKKQLQIKKRSMIIRCDTDLCLNPLSDYNDSDILTVYDYEHKSIYRFYYKDFFKSCLHNLYENDHLFYNPIIPKNPYTNSHWKVYHIYQIYIQCLNKKLKMPHLLESFIVKCNLSLDMFELYNEHELRCHAVKWHIDKQTVYNQFTILSTCLHTHMKIVFKHFQTDKQKQHIVESNKLILFNNYMLFYYDEENTNYSYYMKCLYSQLLLFKKKNMFHLTECITNKNVYKYFTPSIFGMNHRTNTNIITNSSDTLHNNSDDNETDSEIPELFTDVEDNIITLYDEMTTLSADVVLR